MIKNVYTKNAPKAIGPYSQAYIANGMLFTSGQIAIDPTDNSFIDGDIEIQTEQVIKNISAILTSEGYDLDNVIKTTCYLAYMEDFSEFNEVYEKHFKSAPARSCVAVKTLPKNALVEIEVIAVK